MTLHAFLDRLDDYRIHYELGRHRDHTVMVKIAVPGERWEVEFFDDGEIEVEVFRAVGEGLEGIEALVRLFREQTEIVGDDDGRSAGDDAGELPDVAKPLGDEARVRPGTG